MSLGSRLIGFVAASTIATFVVAARGHEHRSLATDLDGYFKVRTALAADKLDGVTKESDELAESSDKAVAAAAKTLAKAKELAPAREAFGELSRALLATVEAGSAKGEKLPVVYVFECPMAKPYGKWLQEKKEIANPYQGPSMLECGKLVATIGGEAGARSGEPSPKPKCKDGCCGGE